MTNAHDPLQPGFVRMIHPETGGIADMAAGATGLFYAAGWVDLTEETMPAEPAPPPPPPPMTEAQARDTREGAAGESAPAEPEAPPPAAGAASPAEAEDAGATRPAGRRRGAGTTSTAAEE